MNPTPAFAVFLLLAAGCTSPTPEAPPFTSPASSRVLVDAIGDAAPSYDIIALDLFELNGSVAVRLEVKNYATGFPLFEARFTTTAGDHFVRLVYDPTIRQGTQVRAESGPIVEGERRDPGVACWFPSLPTDRTSPDPWWIVTEILHNRTGLENGGRITSITVDTSDTEGRPQDHAEARPDFAVKGGANPHQDCPLNHERGRVT